jgi:hypothetical protein
LTAGKLDVKLASAWFDPALGHERSAVLVRMSEPGIPADMVILNPLTRFLDLLFLLS